jgi:protein tyrosine/serine phosphatase
MRVTRTLSPATSASVAVCIALVLLSVVATAQQKDSPTTRIKNFGCINERFYRGAQPQGSDYKDLAAMGVKTIIDLQREGQANEQKMVEGAGMKFYRIPMSDRESPAPEQAAEFLRIVNDPANQPVFIHCKGGRHRTGAMTAIYRLTHDEWTADHAWAEMKEFDFEYGFGHDALKNYVFRYYTQMGNKSVVVNAGTSNK